MNKLAYMQGYMEKEALSGKTYSDYIHRAAGATGRYATNADLSKLFPKGILRRAANKARLAADAGAVSRKFRIAERTGKLQELLGFEGSFGM